MSRILIGSLIVSAAAGGFVSALVANPPVELQPSSPGVAQTGHVNVTGKVLAGHLEAVDSAATAQAIVGNATSTSGTNFGGLFKTNSSAGTGLRGVATSTSGNANGGTFQTASPAGAGIRGFSTAATGVNYGVYGKATSPDGFSGYFLGRLAATGDTLVGGSLGVGPAALPLTSRVTVRDDVNAGPNASVHITNASSPVLPFAPARRALVAQSRGDGTYCVGLIGTAESTTSNDTYGLYGYSTGGAANFGVYGSASGGTSYAGYFFGPLYASSANAGVKAFMIDHPLDPANKVLTHSSVESDERMNIYRGSVRTDSKGYATLTVPAWFDAVNEDIKYTLTLIDESDSATFTMVKVVQRLRNGKFRIRSSQAGASVDWQITGRRHDPVAKHYPLEVERLKSPSERGRYY